MLLLDIVILFLILLILPSGMLAQCVGWGARLYLPHPPPTTVTLWVRDGLVFVQKSQFEIKSSQIYLLLVDI